MGKHKAQSTSYDRYANTVHLSNSELLSCPLQRLKERPMLHTSACGLGSSPIMTTERTRLLSSCKILGPKASKAPATSSSQPVTIRYCSGWRWRPTIRRGNTAENSTNWVRWMEDAQVITLTEINANTLLNHYVGVIFNISLLFFVKIYVLHINVYIYNSTVEICGYR